MIREGLSRAAAWLVRVTLFATLAGAALPAAAAKFYVETKPGELAASDRVNIAEPKPVQLLFQFTTDKKPNAKATKYLKKQIFELVQASGAFSDVQETPVAGQAMLVISIDNITQKDAAKQGFKTGLTFGLAKSVIKDGYLVTAEYNPSAGAAPIKKEVTHGLWMTMGTKQPPPAEVVPVKNADIGIATIVRQSVSHVVNQIALDPGFAGVVQPAGEAAEPTAAEPTAAEPAAAQPTAAEPAAAQP